MPRVLDAEPLGGTACLHMGGPYQMGLCQLASRRGQLAFWNGGGSATLPTHLFPDLTSEGSRPVGTCDE